MLNSDYKTPDRTQDYVMVRKNSSMRSSTILSGKAYSKSAKIRQIKQSRGAFKYLPVYFTNDLVHGSWWMVVGSLLGTIIPIVPLFDIYLHFFSIPERFFFKLIYTIYFTHY